MDNFNNTKDKISEWSKKVLVAVIDHKEVAILGSLGVILLILLTLVVIPNTQQNIRAKESQALVTNTYNNVKNVEAITYGDLENTIRKEESITVALVDPNDTYYEDFETSLKDKNKMSEYTGKLYLYPLIYDKEKIDKFYKLEAGITVIHFENRQETERTILDSQKEIELYLVDHLNSLIRPTSKELEQAEKEKEEAAKAQQLKDEEIIDELKDTAADDQTGEQDTTEAAE